MDGVGEWSTTSFGIGNGNKIGTESGELYINMGSGDLMNTGSGSLLIK